MRCPRHDRIREIVHPHRATGLPLHRHHRKIVSHIIHRPRVAPIESEFRQSQIAGMDLDLAPTTQRQIGDRQLGTGQHATRTEPGFARPNPSGLEGVDRGPHPPDEFNRTHGGVGLDIGVAGRGASRILIGHFAALGRFGEMNEALGVARQMSENVSDRPTRQKRRSTAHLVGQSNAVDRTECVEQTLVRRRDTFDVTIQQSRVHIPKVVLGVVAIRRAGRCVVESRRPFRPAHGAPTRRHRRTRTVCPPSALRRPHRTQRSARDAATPSDRCIARQE